MKKVIILLIALATSTLAIGQEEKTEQIKEVGLTFRNLDNFGFSYKVGTEQSLWRFNAVSIAGSNESKELENEDDSRDSNHFGFAISAGKEYRKLIAKNLEYRYGFDFSFDYSYSKRSQPSSSQYVRYNTSKSNLYTPGINLVLGLNYILGEHFVLGAELMPYLNYAFGESSARYEDYGKETTDLTNFSYGFDSSSILLSLAYRF